MKWGQSGIGGVDVTGHGMMRRMKTMMGRLMMSMMIWWGHTAIGRSRGGQSCVGATRIDHPEVGRVNHLGVMGLRRRLIVRMGRGSSL